MRSGRQRYNRGVEVEFRIGAVGVVAGRVRIVGPDGDELIVLEGDADVVTEVEVVDAGGVRADLVRGAGADADVGQDGFAVVEADGAPDLGRVVSGAIAGVVPDD